MKQTLFTVGPVEMYPQTLRVGGEQVPYFRTKEFSALALDSERILLSLADALPESRALLFTASGTGAMEASVINLLAPGEKALIIVGGSFGERFCQICDDAEIPYDAVRLEPGNALDLSLLASYNLKEYKALLVNANETSSGVLYDIPGLGQICRDNGLYFVVDAISAFLCDPLSMRSMGIDILITSSQKALALAPGLSVITLSPRAVERIESANVRSHYFGLKKYVVDGVRGQAPFTPAVGIILQLHERLCGLEKLGVEHCIQHSAALAAHFRQSIQGLPYRQFPQSPSNALTALSPLNGVSAYSVFETLRSDYGLVVTPNGGSLKDLVFRVGHMGTLDFSDLDNLARALKRIAQ